MLGTIQRVYTSDELGKLGNAIIYFTEKINPLSKTKLLKLIYLLDELSVKTYGIPYFDLQYKVWQAGPVNVDLYSELSSGRPELLKDYIKLSYNKEECYIDSKKKFHDDEFSDNEVNLLETVVTTYGRLSAKKLVELCHRTNTIWYKLAQENGLLDAFNNGRLNTTDFEIDLSEYIKSDTIKLTAYEDHKEFLRFSRRFKS